MASTKDLVQAQAFCRRRLGAALVSGAPGGREVEPARPGRPVLGGLVLAGLLAAGAAVGGLLAPTPSDDWQRRGLVVSAETGAAYVILDDDPDREPELRPVANATSAHLVLGPDVRPTLVAQEAIDERRIGAEVGIPGAPTSVPPPDLLVGDGWTACTAAGAGIRVRISADPAATALPRTGVTVTSGGDLFVVAPGPEGARAYPVPRQGRGGGQTDNLLTAVGGQPAGDAVAVPRAWLALLPRGAPLDWRSFGIRHPGATPAYAASDASGVLDGRVVGELLRVGDEQLLLTDGGPVALSDFAATVYRSVVGPTGEVARPARVDAAPRVARGDDRQIADGNAWPTSAPRHHTDAPCVQLTAAGERADVRLVAGDPAAAATGVRVGETDRVVDPGRGAYVRAGGAAYLVDARGVAHRLDGDGTADLLGYAAATPPVVPRSWLELLGCGASLSREAALGPPEPPGRVDSRCR